MSYMDNLSFSFTGDAGVLPDLERLAEFLADDFRELSAAVAKTSLGACGPEAADGAKQVAPPDARNGTKPERVAAG